MGRGADAEVKIVTDTLHPNEGCWGLFEGPRMVPMPDGSRRNRWIQAVYVIRGDAIAEWTHDYGPVLKYENVQPIIIPGFGDDSVAAVQYLAEQNRHDFYWSGRAKEMLADSTLVKDHLAMLEQELLIKSNRSRFGPGVSVQRNEYQEQTVAASIKEKIRGHRNNKR